MSKHYTPKTVAYEHREEHAGLPGLPEHLKGTLPISNNPPIIQCPKTGIYHTVKNGQWTEAD